MMRSGQLLIVVFVALLLIVLYWPNAVWWLRPRLAVDPRSEDGRALIVENAYLKGELAKYAALSERTLSRSRYEAAFVYARYPFNFKEELVVSVGQNAGVKAGGAVLFSPGSSSSAAVLIGSVSSTRPGISVVTTIFDYRWQSAVRIGSRSIPGLLEGGLDPRVVLVPKDAAVGPGDVVVNADPRFEYGLPLGVVKSTGPSSDNLFQEIELGLPYDLSSLTVLLVEREN